MKSGIGGPVGVFDSGVGGLSVLREIRARLPHEDLLYVADSACAPYGEKGAAFIRARSDALAHFLLERGAKALVLACNTATAAAVEGLRARLACPVLGMEPAVKPAAAATRKGRVGVLATTGTLASARFAALLARFGEGVEVHVRACSGWVERIERGELDGAETRALVAHHVAPLCAAGVDTLILGCTHYPFLKPLIAELAGPGVTLIDTGAAVARHLGHRLTEAGLGAPAGRVGSLRVWVNGDPERHAPVIARLWGAAVEVEALPAACADAGFRC